MLFEVAHLEARGDREPGIDADQRVHPAARARAGDAQQVAHGRFGEVERKIRHDQDAERLGHFAGMLVVVFDRLEFVSQVFLNDVGHVRREVAQPLLDLLRLGPDLVRDEQFVVIGQVHEAGEVLAQAHRVDDREPHLARRNGHQVAQHHRLQHVDALRAGRRTGHLQHQRPTVGK